MPEYRSSQIQGASRFGAAAKFLNLKRAFDDAVRQNQWKMEYEAMNQRGQRTSTAGTLATSGGFSGGELNQFINQGTFPEDYQGQSPKLQRQNLVDTTRLRREFIDRPEVKEYTTISTQVNSMDTLLNKSLKGDVQNKVALDQALISMYNKLTDPQSVVRESEYARTPENLPVINRMIGAIEKIKKGGAGLTDADRKALVQGAKIIADERGKIYNETYNEYKQLSEGYGLNPDLILRGKKEHKSYSESSSGQSQQFNIGGKIYNIPSDLVEQFKKEKGIK